MCQLNPTAHLTTIQVVLGLQSWIIIMAKNLTLLDFGVLAPCESASTIPAPPVQDLANTYYTP